MGRSNREPIFKVRARATGLHWTWPFCGGFNRTPLARAAYKLRCKYRDCRRSFMYGIKLYELP
jgi:hypothetical protein